MPKREIDLAENLIDKMSAGEFEPAKYHDEYRERFFSIVDQKVKGQDITVAAPAPERRGKVVGLMGALKQSLEGTAPQRQRQWCELGTKARRKRRKA